MGDGFVRVLEKNRTIPRNQEVVVLAEGETAVGEDAKGVRGETCQSRGGAG